MNTAAVILIVGGLLGCLYAWRGLWANNETYRVRLMLLDAIHDQEWPLARMESSQFSAVTYRQHYHEVFWGRDPLRLYGRELISLLKQVEIAA